jgi:hypothetical protein
MAAGLAVPGRGVWDQRDSDGGGAVGSPKDQEAARMKPIAKAKTSAYITKAQTAEDARLAALGDFERLQFDLWVDMQAMAADLQPGDILSVLHFAMFEGFILEYKRNIDGSARYIRHPLGRGRTPIETAMEIFLKDHWPSDKLIPERAINYNHKYLKLRAKTFRSTLAFMRDRDAMLLEPEELLVGLRSV